MPINCSGADFIAQTLGIPTDLNAQKDCRQQKFMSESSKMLLDCPYRIGDVHKEGTRYGQNKKDVGYEYTLKHR